MSTTPAESPTPRRTGPPKWGIAAFLLLLIAMAVINQLVTTSGRPVEWIENDLDAALQKATASGQRVFVYVYEPTEAVHKRNELNVFTQRWARQPLEQAVSCRIALNTDVPGGRRWFRVMAGVMSFVDAAGAAHPYKSKPLFLVLDSTGKTVAPPTEGAVDERMFSTYVTAHVQPRQKPPTGQKP